MSRHRFVRQINIEEELDDDAFSDHDDGLSSEDQARWEDAIEQVQTVIGDEHTSGLPDQLVRDVVYNEWFDVPKSIEHLLEEQSRRAAAFERRVTKQNQKQNKETKKMANKQIQGVKSVASSVATSRASSPVGGSTKSLTSASKSGPSIISKAQGLDQFTLDVSSLNLNSKENEVPDEPPPKMTVSREKALEEALRMVQSKDGEQNVSLVVIGHVDAGKSTLMGRLLYELGLIDERKRIANERASDKAGKGSFKWAWELDGTYEERSRGVTMDIAQQSLATLHRSITILDAPGHKDFIPNMISGANQADCALLVVDASTGEFEAGFDRGGQTREHLVLVRSLGVSQVIIAVNKLDQVEWNQDRYEDICSLLQPFLVQTGFNNARISFVPVGALSGINLVSREGKECDALNAWYSGSTLLDLLDTLEPPARQVNAPLRFPISNVFKGQTSGTGVSGRLCSGIVQTGEKLRILPGDETAVVKSIELEEASVSWAAAGSNVTLYLTLVDPIHLSIGNVLCPQSDLVPLATSFTARIILFDLQLPITSGAAVELFHHSRDVPATLSKLVAVLDRTTGAVVKKNPRVLTKSTSAEVVITLRSSSMSGPSARSQAIPIEPFSVNKDMGRILLRRGGETVAAGIVLQILS